MSEPPSSTSSDGAPHRVLTGEESAARQAEREQASRLAEASIDGTPAKDRAIDRAKWRAPSGLRVVSPRPAAPGTGGDTRPTASGGR